MTESEPLPALPEHPLQPHMPAAEAQPSPPPPEQTPEASPPPPAGAPLPRRDLLPWLYGVGFVVLAAAIGFVGWTASQWQAQPSEALQSLQHRVAQLEQRPAAASAGGGLAPMQAGLAAQKTQVQALQTQVAGLATQVNELRHRPQPDIAALQAQLKALQQRPAPDLAPLQAQIAALDKKTTDNAQAVARLDALSAQVSALSAQVQSAETEVTHRLDADEARLASLQQAASQMNATAERAARLARIEVAEVALAAGRPLGDLPGAPPAIAHFANTPPPTEAALRLAFPQAEQAALAARTPEVGGKTMLGRMVTRAEDLVTVRQGDRVLLGNPAAGVLARARSALDAGDLAGAVAAVSSLSGPPADAMANWLAQAKVLLAAQAGLADMAAHA